MKVAHFGSFAPNSCGLFHTTKDSVLAERSVGIDSQFIDWGYAREYDQRYSRVGLSYEGVTTIAPQWAIDEADILVLHSALPKFVKDCGKPVVSAIHGRPEYSFACERLKKGSTLNLYHSFVKDPQVVLFYTYWKEHLDYWNMLLDQKVEYVPAMVDLETFRPDQKRVEFQNNGCPNILVADIWREDVTPFNVVFAAAKFIKEACPAGRLHIYGMSRPNETTALGNILNPLRERGVVGDMHGLMRNIKEVYPAADLLVTPHNIATRVVRESLASGCPIVSGLGCGYTKFQADPHDVPSFAKQIELCWDHIKEDPDGARQAARDTAERCFNLEQAGEHLLEMYKKVPLRKTLAKRKKKVKKRDYRIHTFTPYATEAEEKNIGRAYNQYMGLIPNNDWACFLDHDAMFTTTDWYHQLYEIIDANPGFSCFTAVTNRIGNVDQKFGSVDAENHDIVYHREIGVAAQSQFRTDVKDISKHQLLSGVLILVKKATWKEVGGFMEEGFLGVDNDFDRRIREKGMKTGVAKGVYLYHWYRFKDSELKPLK